MKARARPEQIDSILNALDPDDETMTVLQAYIADLEAKQPARPDQIATILAEVVARYSAEAGASLESYISQLEANQQATQPGKKSDSTTDRYWRSVRREKNIKACFYKSRSNSWKHHLSCI
jgi:hypothetical protein